MDTKDSNGSALVDGDSVQIIKDLKVKGSSITLKRGMILKNIRLTSNPDEIEYRQGKTTITALSFMPGYLRPRIRIVSGLQMGKMTFL